jgi:hypothetical protein
MTGRRNWGRTAFFTFGLTGFVLMGRQPRLRVSLVSGVLSDAVFPPHDPKVRFSSSEFHIDSAAAGERSSATRACAPKG